MTHLRFDLTVAEYEALAPDKKREWNEWLMAMWLGDGDLVYPAHGEEIERYDDWSRP